MLLIIDNYDSFTFNLLDYLSQLKQDCVIIRNDTPKKDWPAAPDSILISPGPMDPMRAGRLMEMLEFYHNKAPILGICLGHQAIGLFFGSKLNFALKPMHGKISQIHAEDDIIFKNIPKVFNVVRYHSLVLSDLSSELKLIAKTEEGEVMVIKHASLPIYGIQFHPEAALTEYGLLILSNWLESFKVDIVN
jgi:anthranilate synthase/aminodeoxychorismate synthase-like glutamine amidotransferase